MAAAGGSWKGGAFKAPRGKAQARVARAPAKKIPARPTLMESKFGAKAPASRGRGWQFPRASSPRPGA